MFNLTGDWLLLPDNFSLFFGENISTSLDVTLRKRTYNAESIYKAESIGKKLKIAAVNLSRALLAREGKMAACEYSGKLKW